MCSLNDQQVSGPVPKQNREGTKRLAFNNGRRTEGKTALAKRILKNNGNARLVIESAREWLSQNVSHESLKKDFVCIVYHNSNPTRNWIVPVSEMIDVIVPRTTHRPIIKFRRFMLTKPSVL